jgi:acylphosphatase
MENPRRMHVWITGRVQRVFFRMETQRSAKNIGVTGWVRNLRDGRVEVVMEGPVEKVARMVDWCRKGPSLAHVTHLEQVEEVYTGEFDDFRVVS